MSSTKSQDGVPGGDIASEELDLHGRNRHLVVVGIGASAGGLDALKQFFGAVQRSPGLAFVVVTHQQAGNVTLLPELLGKHTALPVVAIREATKIEPNVVYIAPAEDVILEDGTLLIVPPPPKVPHHPIDTFFRSLASACEDRAAAIVLSGTGSDGTSGIGAIKLAGGLVLAQDPNTAKYPDMPASSTDIGRPISDLAANLRYDDLVTDAREVLRSLVFQEHQILTKDGAWRLLRILPYRTAENVIDGLVLTFIDIDRIKREREEADAARVFAQSLVEALPTGVAVVDAELRVSTANSAFLTTLKTSAKHALGEPILSIADGALDTPELVDGLQAVRSGGTELRDVRVKPAGQRFGGITLSVSARRMVVQPGQPVMMLLMVDSVQ